MHGHETLGIAPLPFDEGEGKKKKKKSDRREGSVQLRYGTVLGFWLFLAAGQSYSEP
jgi:hypothetical protein